MEVLYFLVPITLIIVGVGVALFMWAVRNGQMDDLERPGHSILYDDDEEMIPEDARQKKPHRASRGRGYSAPATPEEKITQPADRGRK